MPCDHGIVVGQCLECLAEQLEHEQAFLARVRRRGEGVGTRHEGQGRGEERGTRNEGSESDPPLVPTPYSLLPSLLSSLDERRLPADLHEADVPPFDLGSQDMLLLDLDEDVSGEEEAP